MADVKFDRSYGVLSILFDKEVPAFSPVFGDVERVVSYDEEQKEIISFVPVDYKKLAEQRGIVDNWSLDAMLKAGIDPRFNLHTGSSVSRLEGIDTIQSAEADVNAMFDKVESPKTE